jgi:peroxin-11B
LSSTRRIMRLGRSFEFIEKSLKSIKIDDSFLRYTLTMASLNQACYLLLDNILWFNSMKIINLKNNNGIDRELSIRTWSNKFWLFSSILNLSRDINELLTAIQNSDETLKTMARNRYVLDKTSGMYSPAPVGQDKFSLMTKLRYILLNKKHHPLLVDFVKNIFDIMLPLSSLDYIKLSPGSTGLCGFISSLLGLLVLWDIRYKLMP